jgi:small subunit ribosomal protein S25e
MGGKKKLTTKQMERTQEKKDDAQAPKRGGKTGSGFTSEKKAPSIILPDLKSEKVIGEVKKMKAVTPYAIASRFNLRLSVARDMLDELTQRGILEYVSGSKSIKIYKPHD